MLEKLLVLVDKNNNQIGTMEKLEAHKKWLLHRAFSVFLFNKAWELLIQQRAKDKYHCGGLWTNTVCSHQAPWEWNIHAAVRRLGEELGIYNNIEKLEELWSLRYKVEFDNGLIEHEYDFIIQGNYDGIVIANPDEVMDYKWISLNAIKKDIKENPEKYTPWFKAIIKKKLF